MSAATLKKLLKKLSSMNFDVFSSQKEDLVEEVIKLCHLLLRLEGESTSTAISTEVLKAYREFSTEDRIRFFSLLESEFVADPLKVEHAIESYREQNTQQALQALAIASASPRKELFRILNIAPDATAALVNMRADLLTYLAEHPQLEVINQDLLHLFRSWFNRGFLHLRRIDWQTPALVLEKLIEYESVHEIKGWTDLRRRLEDDRRCYAFFHPVIPDTPLIFVEVALTREMSASIGALLDQQLSDSNSQKPFNTAVFYSINNCLQGLRGVSFGSFLIKQVVEHMARECPAINTWTTLSPVPGFLAWLQKQSVEDLALSTETSEVLQQFMDTPLLEQNPGENDKLRPVLLKLCARYLLGAKSRGKPADPVARFHLGNGARLARINWLADISANGLRQSAGIMVNYVYDPATMAENHEAYALENELVCSQEVKKLAE